MALAAIRRLALVALLAVALGFIMQAILLATKLGAGGAFPGLLFLVDLTQGIAWSTLVCMGVSVGISVSKARPFLAGLLALVFAPLAVAAANPAGR
jgi:hypothetical protein